MHAARHGIACGVRTLGGETGRSMAEAARAPGAPASHPSERGTRGVDGEPRARRQDAASPDGATPRSLSPAVSSQQRRAATATKGGASSSARDGGGMMGAAGLIHRAVHLAPSPQHPNSKWAGLSDLVLTSVRCRWRERRCARSAWRETRCYVILLETTHLSRERILRGCCCPRSASCRSHGRRRGHYCCST